MGRGLQHHYLETVCEFSNFRYKIFIGLQNSGFFVHRTDLSFDNEVSDCFSASA